MRSATPLALALAVLATASPAAAQDLLTPGDFRISLESELFHATRDTEEVDEAGVEEIQTDETELGFLTRGLGARLAIAATPRFLVGGQLALVRTTLSIVDPTAEREEITTLGYRFGPFAEVWLTRAERAVFFLQVGFEVVGDRADFEDDTLDVKSNLYGARIGLGLHAFAADNLSIDPSLDFSFLGGRREHGDGISGYEGDVRQWRVGLTIALSGWIFDTADPPPPAATGAD